MESLKHKLEAILFSTGKKISIEELAKLANTSTSMSQQALNELKEEYKERNSSLMLADEGSAWKLIVKDEFLPIVKKIITETELTKTIMETLAVIAFKYPIKQADLIKIRTNKAYDHLKELEEMGYITRQKHGRTKLIKLTQKFFEYFDLPEENLKEHFRDFESIAKAIEEKETEVEKINKEQLKKAQEEKEKDQKIKREIDLIDDRGREVPLEVIENDEKETEEPETKLGNLDVVDEPSEEELEKQREKIEKIKEEDQRGQEEEREKKEKEEKKEKGEPIGLELNPEQEKEVDEKVEEMMQPKETPEQKDI